MGRIDYIWDKGISVTGTPPGNPPTLSPPKARENKSFHHLKCLVSNYFCSCCFKTFSHTKLKYRRKFKRLVLFKKKNRNPFKNILCWVTRKLKNFFSLEFLPFMVRLLSWNIFFHFYRHRWFGSIIWLCRGFH